MTDGDLSHITDKLAAALSRRIDLSDSENMALLIDQHLQAQVLQNYRTQLEGLQGTEMLAWMLHRIAGLEARVLALHAAGQLTEHARESTAGTVPPAAADFAVLPRSARVPCDDNLAQTGFYSTEVTAEGTPFRWVGPTPQASIFVPRMQLPIEVRIHVVSVFFPESLNEVRVALEGGSWVSATVEWDRSSAILVARPEAGPLSHAGSMRLDINAGRAGSPSTRGSDDGRELAIAVSSFEFTSL